MKATGTALAILIAFALGAGLASADQVTDAIGQANAAYGSGDYKDASTHLQTALVGVNQMLIDLLIDQFPDPPAGWTAEEAEGIDASMIGAGLFATLVVSREYYPPNDSVIEVTVAANSPMLSTLRMFMSNPMLASMTGQSGMTTTSACGFDAVENFDDDSETYELHVLAGKATLISFQGETASDVDHIGTLAGSMNCQAVVGIVE